MSSALMVRLAALGGLLLVPVAVTLRRRGAARRAPDAVVAWYRHWRGQNVLGLLTWAAWPVALALLGAGPLSWALFGPLGVGPWTSWLLMLVPVPLVLAVCHVLSAPVYARVPEVNWSFSAVLRQALWGQCGLAVAIVLVGLAADSVARQNTVGALLPGAGGMLALLLSAMGLWSARGLVLTPLPPGELRDRLFELADERATKLQEAYLLPTTQWRLPGVFTLPGGTVNLSADAVRLLTRREVDALLAMELAFVARQRWRQLWSVLVGVLIPVVLGPGVLLLERLGYGGQGWEYVPLLSVLIFWATRTTSEGRFGPAVDLKALEITSDPEALLTALAKLERAGLLPLPSPSHRVEDLAARIRVPPDRLREILDRSGTGSDTYQIPETQFGGDAPRRAARARRANLLFWALVVLSGVVPAASVRLTIDHGGPAELGGLVGLVLVEVLRAGLLRVIVARWREEVRRRLNDRAPADAELLGFAPAPAPRIYDGFFDWDTGMLAVQGGRLTFQGERTVFALRRAAVMSVAVGRGVPGWVSPPRVYVTWQADGSGGVFQLSVAPGLWGRRRVAEALRDRLEAWRTGTGGLDEVPDEPPPTEEKAPGLSPERVATFPVFLTVMLPRLLLAAMVCGVLGLSFDPKRGGVGWAAAVVSGLDGLLGVAPFWLHREPERGER